MLEVDNTWMWRLNPHHGRDGAQGVRRLGPPAPRLRWALRTRAFCSLPDRIPGHGRSPRDLLRCWSPRSYHAAAQSCGCTAEMEVAGLIPGTDMRPGQLLHSF